MENLRFRRTTSNHLSKLLTLVIVGIQLVHVAQPSYSIPSALAN